MKPDRAGELGFARSAYDVSAQAYERGRPGYPPEALAWLGEQLNLSAGSWVLDLAAGTGKFTRMLGSTGARVVAVEPVQAMVAQLANVGNVSVLAATAESIPLSDSSVDATTVAQAFHWFRADAALAEIHRVLRPGGRLGLIWNRPDKSVEWVAELMSLIPSKSGRTGVRRKRGAWRSVLGELRTNTPREMGMPSWLAEIRQTFAATTLFTSLNQRHFGHTEPMAAGAVVDLVASLSRFSRLAEDDQVRVLDQVEARMATMPAVLAFPYRTDVFWCARR